MRARVNEAAFAGALGAALAVFSVLGDEELSLKLTDPAVDFLVKNGFDENYGARPLKRSIQKWIEDPLSEKILTGEFSKGDEIEVDFTGSSGMSSYAINCPMCYTEAYTTFGVNCIVAPHVPNNAGTLDAVRVTATILDGDHLRDAVQNDYAGKYVVVEVTVAPKGEAMAVRLNDFTLRSMTRSPMRT